MTTQTVVALHGTRVWVARIALFAIGAFILVLPFFRDNLGPIGVIGGVFIILSLLVSAVARHPIGWTMITLTVMCAALVPIGLGLYGLAGGPQGDNALVGIGFMMGLGGLFFFFASAIITMVIALRVYVHEWRDRHGRAGAPPPTTSH